jgi:hypothetical protein
MENSQVIAADVISFGPLPPVHMIVGSLAAERIFTWALGVVFMLLILGAVVSAVRRGSLVPVMCVLGAMFCALLEPLADSHLQVWWPAGEMPTVLTAYGRKLPLLVLFANTVFNGTNVLLFLYWIERFRSGKAFWTLYLIQVGVAVALEPPGISYDLWNYFGNQGPRFFGYPIWWPFVGGACTILAGTVVWKLLPLLNGWKVVLVAPLVPMSVAATYWAAGWPMFLALNTESANWVIHIAALIAVAQAVFIVWICSVALDFPARR